MEAENMEEKDLVLFYDYPKKGFEIIQQNYNEENECFKDFLNSL
jgi:hypothetical protein